MVSRAVEERQLELEFFERILKSEIIRNYDYKPLYEDAQLTGDVSNLFDENAEISYQPEYLLVCRHMISDVPFRNTND